MPVPSTTASHCSPNAAFQSSNTKFALVLSNPNSSKPKRVNINEYKGKFFVNIREWYEKDGELKPGFKGLTINKEQWQVVLDQLNAFHAALTACDKAPKRFVLGEAAALSTPGRADQPVLSTQWCTAAKQHGARPARLPHGHH